MKSQDKPTDVEKSLQQKCFEKGVESSFGTMFIGFIMCLVYIIGLTLFRVEIGFLMTWFFIGLSGFFAAFLNFFIMGDY